jgi:hypothetical protein
MAAPRGQLRFYSNWSPTMNQADLADFISTWLATWTGNQPEKLVDFYTADAYYQDPARPQGLRGRTELLAYFRKLLAVNPAWIWEPVEIMPTAAGCCLKWQATIPLGSKTVTGCGLDIVEIVEHKISRNEVYFDPSLMRP